MHCLPASRASCLTFRSARPLASHCVGKKYHNAIEAAKPRISPSQKPIKRPRRSLRTLLGNMLMYVLLRKQEDEITSMRLSDKCHVKSDYNDREFESENHIFLVLQ